MSAEQASSAGAKESKERETRASSLAPLAMSTEMPNPPEEIIYDVLSRLPVVSLCRFRCVSKPWRSLISSPHFIRAHLNATTAPTSLMFFTFPSVQNPLSCMEICNSCDGLVLILDEDFDCFLVNPSTRESRKVPRSPFKSCSPFQYYGFGYDSSVDDYKVVNFCVIEGHVDNAVSLYSLKSNSWRRIQNYPYDHSHFVSRPRDFVCGALHWIARPSNGTDDVIVALDLADEKFRTVSCPVIGWTTGVLHRCLCVFVELQPGPCGLDAWVMKEYGVSDSWTKIITITCDRSLSSWMCRPLCLPWTSQVLIFIKYSKLFIFDPREEESKALAVHGLLAPFEMGTYVESLVSPWRLCQ